MRLKPDCSCAHALGAPLQQQQQHLPVALHFAFRETFWHSAPIKTFNDWSFNIYDVYRKARNCKWDSGVKTEEESTVWFKYKESQQGKGRRGGYTKGTKRGDSIIQENYNKLQQLWCFSPSAENGNAVASAIKMAMTWAARGEPNHLKVVDNHKNGCIRGIFRFKTVQGCVCRMLFRERVKRNMLLDCTQRLFPLL